MNIQHNVHTSSKNTSMSSKLEEESFFATDKRLRENGTFNAQVAWY
jgi:hypothetical protein